MVVKIVEGLTERGHEVVIITSSPEGESVDEKNGVRMYRTRPPNLYYYTDAHRHSFFARCIWHLVNIFNYPVARWVNDILEKEQPDIVHTHNLIGLSFLIPGIIRKGGFRHIHTVHDVQLVEPSGMILKAQEKSWRYTGPPTQAYTWLMKKLMGSPEVVISPSQFLLDFYVSRGFFPQSERILLRNPSTFDGQALPGAHDAEGDTPFRFLYLGQVEAHKGVELLLGAYKALPLSGSELHIVGAGSQLEHIRALAEGDSRIIVHGKKERAELPELFAQTHMTVVPSLCYENSPTVIFESLHFGVPVLASDIEGIAELIQEGENGLTFTAGESESLVEKMQWAFLHREELRSMNKKIPDASGSREEYIEKLTQLYNKNN